METFKTIVADPPWFERGSGRIKRGADRHYKLMKTSDIIALAPHVRDLADPGGCHLYLWTTNNHLHDAIHVMEAWGFRYVTIITWVKDRMGLGQYYRGLTEHCLFGVRGKVPYKILDGKRQQGLTAFNASKREHSRKPEEMRDMIETVSYSPYLEMFARPPHPRGWATWGIEADEPVTLKVCQSQLEIS